MIFAYTVKNEHGETIKGKVEAPNREHASAILRERGLLVITVQPLNEDSFAAIRSMFFGIKPDEIVNFTRQLSTMITAGLTLTESLHILQQQSKPQMEKMISEILREVEGGSTLAKALDPHKKYFSQVYIQLIRAGETAGVLDRVLSRLADNLEKEREFNAKVKGALIYPTIVIMAMFAVGFVMMVFVIPKLTSMYKDLGAQLPLLTQILITVSDFMVNFWWAVIGLVVGGVSGFKAWQRSPKGRLLYDTYILKVPVMGILQEKILLTEFCRTISLLLGAGVSMLQALEILTASMENKLFQNALADASKQVEKGIQLSQVIGKYTFFPPILGQMLAVGEETGKIDDVMLKLSLYFESESDHAVKNLTAAFEPLIMIVLGLGVGVLVMAIILPMFNITQNIQ
jgi:type IV pilus assembly protein PilC